MTEQSTGAAVERVRRARRAARPITFALVACTTLCLLIPRPGYGDNGNTTIPDTGAPPVATAPLGPPGAGTGATVTTPVAGPMATQIMNESAAVEALGEQLKQADIDVQAAHDATMATQQAWQQADTTARDLRAKADVAAAEAYKKAESLGPLGNYADAMHQLGVLAPGFADGTPGGVAGSQTAAQDATRAEEAAKNAYAAYQSALATELQQDQKRDALNTTFTQRSTALADLKSRNTQAVAQAEAAQDATDQQLAAGFAAGSNADGMVANPIALKAVQFALSQRGKPYVWGAEGPNSYDCSGLVWASYHSVKITLPRVAKDQYHGTTPIDISKVLPGDLLFFSTTSKTDWTTISHVGMYLGDGKMVEAPTTGEVVKIATVWWSAFFGATRVVAAVAAPHPTPSPSHSSTPSPHPSSAPPSNPPPSSTPPSSAPPSTKPTPSASSSSAAAGGSDTGGQSAAPSQSNPAPAESHPAPSEAAVTPSASG